MMSDNLACQEEFWEELIDGKITAMSPRPMVNHIRIAFRIAYLFESYFQGRKCTLFFEGVDLHLTKKDSFLPDMMVVCEREKIKIDGVYGAPDLVAEILSPSKAKRARGYKKGTCAKCGIQEYWLVGPAEKSAEVYLKQRFVRPPRGLLHLPEGSFGKNDREKAGHHCHQIQVQSL